MRMLIGATMLLLVLPKFGYQCLMAWYHQKKITFYHQQFAGKNMERINHRTVTVTNSALSDIDTWFLYLKGKYDLIGPSPIDFDLACRLDKSKRARLDVKPGVISPFNVKKTSGIAHKSEGQVAKEFALNAGLARRLQVFLIWLLQKLLGSAHHNLYAPAAFKLLGVRLTNLSMKEAVTRVIDSLGRERRIGGATKYAFVNADCVNKYYEDSHYKDTLNQFDNVFADGIGVKIAARWQGVSIVENVNGTDMFPFLCTELVANKKSLYLLGASKSVVGKVAAKLRREYPGIELAGYSDGYSYQSKPEELRRIINESGAQLLLVAMGAPRQENWIRENVTQLKINAVIGVGGLFDFYSEEVSRAPIWLRELSLEWVWRLGAQPLSKGKRYLYGNPLFLIRAAIASRKARSKALSNQELNHDLL